MLTGIQERLLALLAAGRSADEIAAALGLPKVDVAELVRALLRVLAAGGAGPDIDGRDQPF